ncbi:SdpI family protein [Microbacterium aurantiacum]|uniref:SdpI family protein n=1 Tax=Microbacterium aurantiacum TaxID=162393 RepID=UPI0040350459
MTDPTTPLWAMLVTVVGLGAAGVALVILARRSRDGRLPRNQIAGIRTALTLSSDAAWYAAQRASASANEIAGWGTLIGAAVLVAIVAAPLPSGVALPTTVVVVLGTGAWMLVWVLIGAARGQRAAHAHR